MRHVREALAAGREPAVECCWWLDEAGVQFRIAGRAVLATASDAPGSARRAAVERPLPYDGLDDVAHAPPFPTM